MFTGIIEAVGEILSVVPGHEVRTLTVRAPTLAEDLTPGDSVSVDGACLTVESTIGEAFRVTAVGATLARTIAGSYDAGTTLNLERAARLDARMDGHLVQGHVDGVGRFLSAEPDGDYHLLTFELPPDVVRTSVVRGSIAINGVSLTIQDLGADSTCRIAVVPYTWKHTNFHRLEPGSGVNVEGDLIGKYVGKMLASYVPVGENGASQHAV